MQSKHTPGPWMAYNAIGSRTLTSWRVRSECVNQPCGICKMDESLTGEQEIANARLIAAAPDLLSALQELLRVADAYSDAMREHGRGCHELGSDADSNSASGIARAAIAKAIGPA